MAAKDNYEFVRLEDHPIVHDNLTQSSEALSHAVETAFDASKLQQEKHEKIVEAKRLVAELLEKISELNRLMLREKFEAHLKKSVPKPIIYRELKKKSIVHRKITKEDKETLVRSEKALSNLQKNLEVLKKQLY